MLLKMQVILDYLNTTIGFARTLFQGGA